MTPQRLTEIEQALPDSAEVRPMNITVTMTKEHAQAVIHAMEMYQRISMGAWMYVADYAGGEHGKVWGPGVAECAELAETLRRTITPDAHPHGHRGIGNASQRAKLTYEVQGVMRQVIAKHEPSYLVWHHAPLSLSGLPIPAASEEERN